MALRPVTYGDPPSPGSSVRRRRAPPSSASHPTTMARTLPMLDAAWQRAAGFRSQAAALCPDADGAHLATSFLPRWPCSPCGTTRSHGMQAKGAGGGSPACPQRTTATACGNITVLTASLACYGRWCWRCCGAMAGSSSPTHEGGRSSPAPAAGAARRGGFYTIGLR
ncbi:hypothetical protein SORBI_3004G324600 [Sorghum bicolor]|uniref:Uncharacterized protein n=1 Tax=Sorghum bicolor TaxID=4558 RepID=A0A194YST3_SORBI|nr:hypothetical protein SORBI_3004G324600 [Sorghum bicolor]